MRTDPATMQDYVKEKANLRPYFGELRRYCQAQEIPMVIVRQGLDFYIQALLDKEGHSQVPVYAVNTSFTNQVIAYEYRYTRPGQEAAGNSKALVVERFLDAIVLLTLFLVPMALPSFPGAEGLLSGAFGGMLRGTFGLLGIFLAGLVALLIFPEPIVRLAERLLVRLPGGWGPRTVAAP